MSIGPDVARHVQVLNGGIGHIAERSQIGVVIHEVDSQRVAVAIEHAPVGITFRTARPAAAFNVGIESGVHIVLALSLNHLLAEVVPVASCADGEVVWFNLIVCREGRSATVDIHLHLIINTRAREVNHLVTLFAFLWREFYVLDVHGVAGLVEHRDAQHHLGTIVPNGIRLVGIFPGDAGGKGSLVFPLSGIGGYTPQMDFVDDTPFCLYAPVVPAPCLRHHTAHTVGQAVQRAILQHVLVYGIYQGAVDKGIMGLRRVGGVGLTEDGLKIFLLTCQ